MKRADKNNYIERRSYIRIRVPIPLSYAVSGDNRIYSVTTTDVSANGVRFENRDKAIKQSDAVEITLEIPEAKNPVHAKGSVVWKNRVSLEDNSPFDVGVEFVDIEEDNKNTFLKFLCDYLYNLPEGEKNAKY
jgi:c-di-GMP-binding flagellar brake protein YcgR